MIIRASEAASGLTSGCGSVFAPLPLPGSLSASGPASDPVSDAGSDSAPSSVSDSAPPRTLAHRARCGQRQGRPDRTPDLDAVVGKTAVPADDAVRRDDDL